MAKQWIIKAEHGFGSLKYEYYVDAEQMFRESGTHLTADINHALVIKTKKDAELMMIGRGIKGAVVPADKVDLKINREYIQSLKDKRAENERLALKYQEELKQMQENYDREVAAEEKRVADLKCPCCKMNNKTLVQIHQQTSASEMVVGGPRRPARKPLNEYYLCNDCGVHFTDVRKKEFGARPGGSSNTSGSTLRHIDLSGY